MSRLGKIPIAIPKGVEIQLGGDLVEALKVKGPLGELFIQLPLGLSLKLSETEVLLVCDDKKIAEKAFYGLFRSLIENAIIGVFTGYEIRLSLIGVGYRAAVQGNKLDLQLGFSYPTYLEIPKELQVVVEKGTIISVKGADKRAVGQFAATIRALKPPEPYKGKGVRYENEYVRKKEGKAAKGKS